MLIPSAVRYFPPHWSFPQAACFAYGYDTAYHVLVECGQIHKGETILIHGATGGVGIPAVHLAVMLGARVIATTRAHGKVAFLQGLGVKDVIVLDERGKQFSAQVKKMTGGKVFCSFLLVLSSSFLFPLHFTDCRASTLCMMALVAMISLWNR